jgi:prepilin-type N-terminal cleavage/methylation domain-containing protein/prepilin-type processing-associated H-X9-DG protein
MKKKGFTLIELLVVISIIALLMAILMPALAKVRQIAARVVCGSHLSGLGKSIELYSNEHEGRYPRAGRKQSVWGAYIQQWNPPRDNIDDEEQAFGLLPASSSVMGNRATISSCLYLLIKYSDASAKQFVCGGDTSASIFNLSKFPPGMVTNNDLMEAWDFGGDEQTGAPDETVTRTHYSYSYQTPFGNNTGITPFPLTSMSDSGMAIMADKNPYMTNPPVDPGWAAGEMYVCKAFGGSKQLIKWGNSPNHLQDGQNVLFIDGHVIFSDEPSCGVDNDNIYSMADPLSQQSGNLPEAGMEPWPIPVAAIPSLTVLPQIKTDSILVNEGVQVMPTGTEVILKTPIPQ